MDFTYEKVSIKEYYLKKYQQMSKDILENRLDTFYQEIALLEDQNKTLSERLNNLDEEIIQDNDYVDNLNNYEEQVNQAKDKITVINDEINSINETIKRKQIILDNNIDKVLVSNLKEVDTLSSGSDIYQDNYLMAKEVKELRFKIFELEKELEKVTESVNNDINNITSEVASLTRNIKEVTKESFNLQVERNNSEILKLNVYMKELTESFKVKDEKNLKVLEDKIDYFSMNETLTDEMISILDNLLDDFSNQLNKLKTIQEITDIKKKKLSLLNYELNKDYVDTSNMAFYFAVRDEYEEKISLVDKEIQLLEEKRQLILKVFTDNDKYSSLYHAYQLLVNQRNELKEQVNNILNEYNAVISANASSGFYLNKNKDTSETETKLQNLMDNKKLLDDRLRQLNESISIIELNVDNNSFIRCFNDLTLIEKSLPSIYDKYNQLKEKHQEVLRHLDDMNKYNNKRIQIEEQINNLNNEDN